MKSILLVALALSSNLAHAYLPPSEFILKTAASKKVGLKALKIKSTVSEVQGEKPTSVHFKQVTLYDAGSGSLRSLALDDAGRELYIVERNLRHARSTQEGALLSDVVLFDHQLAGWISALRRAEIALKTEAELLELEDEDQRRGAEPVSLGRMKAQVSWVVGTETGGAGIETGSAGKPQLWIEKDTFLPSRLLVAPKAFGLRQDDWVDLRFHHYRFAKEFPFPRMIEAAQRGVTFLQDEATEISPVADLPELKKPVTSGFTDVGNAADSGVRELIRRYYQLVR